MSRSGALLVATALLLPLSTGCASGPNLLRREPADDGETQRLKAAVVDLQRQVRVNEVELARLRDRVRELEGSGVATPSARQQATPAPAPVPVEEPIPRAPERPSRTDRVGDSGIEETDLELPPSAADRGGPQPPGSVAMETAPVETITVEPAPRPAETTTRPVPPPASVAVTAAAQALYDRGYALHNEGRYVDAEATFQRFLQAHPATDLSDNAQYWIGEARLARGDHRGALSAFMETVEKYPEGNKVPDALLKAARSLRQTGDLGGARLTYDELIRSHPNTAAAAVAEEERAALGS